MEAVGLLRDGDVGDGKRGKGGDIDNRRFKTVDIRLIVATSAIIAGNSNALL
jgi:hypothetical protein